MKSDITKECFYILVIFINSVYRKDENHYP